MNQEQVQHAIKHGTVVQLNGNCILDGTRVTIKRQSKKTGNLTCVLVENSITGGKRAVDGSGYKIGDEIHVMPFCIDEKKPRLEELQSRLMQAYFRTTEELTRIVNDGKEARIAFSRAILQDINDETKTERCELLVDQVRWGCGIKQDLRARHAARILHYASQGETDLKDLLKHTAEELEASLSRNAFLSHSTSQFSNAIEEMRAEVAREFAEWCRNRVERLIDLRAEMEVL